MTNMEMTTTPEERAEKIKNYCSHDQNCESHQNISETCDCRDRFIAAQIREAIEEIKVEIYDLHKPDGTVERYSKDIRDRLFKEGFNSAKEKAAEIAEVAWLVPHKAEGKEAGELASLRARDRIRQMEME